MRKKTSRKIHRASAGQRKKRSAMLKGMSIKGLLICAVLFMVAFAVMAVYNPEALAMAFAVPVAFGTTLAAAAPRAYGRGDLTEHGVIASDIIYEGAACGDNGAGYARPLVAGDKFLGFAEAKVDNSTGSAGDLNVRCIETGFIQLAVSGAVITDIGQSVYASDDDTFVFVAPSNSYIGNVVQFVSAGVVIVRFQAKGIDPFGENDIRETKDDNYTIDALDGGKIIYVDTDAKIMTLLATVAGLKVTFVNAGAFGAVLLKVAPNANDKIQGADVTSADNKFMANTKATARRGDYITLVADGTDGWWITDIKGTWARE